MAAAAKAVANGARKGPQELAAMARQSATRGTKRFVYVTSWEDRPHFPYRRLPYDDNPFRAWRGWQRFRWYIHDLRVYGFWELLRKWHYMQDVWRKKGEKIYHGTDELGNKYWSSNDSTGFSRGRWMEPADPHILRGADCNAAPPPWMLWLTGNLAHTPAEIRARGEYGAYGRIGRPNPYNIQYNLALTPAVMGMGIDPTYVPTTALPFSPWYQRLKESGFSRWVVNMGRPANIPMMEPHDLKPEIVEDFYRGQAAYQRWSRGQDHDEWK